MEIGLGVKLIESIGRKPAPPVLVMVNTVVFVFLLKVMVAPRYSVFPGFGNAIVCPLPLIATV
jgi:hypothetical protein